MRADQVGKVTTQSGSAEAGMKLRFSTDKKTRVLCTLSQDDKMTIDRSFNADEISLATLLFSFLYVFFRS